MPCGTWSRWCSSKRWPDFTVHDECAASSLSLSFSVPCSQVLRELNLLLIQRGSRFSFDLLLLGRRPLAGFAEPSLSAHLRQAQPSQDVRAYLITRPAARRLLADLRLSAYVAYSAGGNLKTAELSNGVTMGVSVPALCCE